MAVGFAVADHTGIIVNTVAETERAAIVNWLVVRRGVMITIYDDDKAIAALWNKHRLNGGDDIAAEVVAVTISLTDDQPAHPAAPIALEALEAALPMLQTFDDSGTLAPGETSLMAPVIDKVEQAIALLAPASAKAPSG